MRKPLKVLDLFSGAGGLSTGFSMEGFEISGAIEFVRVYAETHRANFPKAATQNSDISALSPSDYSRLSGIKPGDVDMIIGGPPCQTFSSIGTPKLKSLLGKEVLTDPRNYLFESYFEYVRYFKPRAFLMENVPQLITKYGGELFRRIENEISDIGYSHEVRVLNAADFGVPQTRRRMFIAGMKSGETNPYYFPHPSHQSMQASDVNLELAFDSPLPLYTTVFDAIGDLPKVFDGCRIDELPYSKSRNLTSYQKSLRNKIGRVRNNICRMSNERAKAVFSHMKQGDRYMDLPAEIRQILPFREDIFHDRLKRLDSSKPSWTVLAHIGMDGYMYIHPHENRTLSVREAARIQSFPDNFIFLGNMREQYIQVGNAVPPLLAKALASKFKEALE